MPRTLEMCGITVCVYPVKTSDRTLKSSEWLQLSNDINRRGPDLQHREGLHVAGSNLDLYLTFSASTLHLRGPNPVVQPHTSDRAIFCWNGEVFKGIDVSLDENDGSVLFSALENLEDANEIYHLFGQIEGPYAFVYYQRKSQILYFARDPLGRKSLLLHHPTEKYPFYFLSSVSIGPGYGCTFEELDPKYIYSFDLSRLSSSDFSTTTTNREIIQQEIRMSYCKQLSFAAVFPVNDSIPKNPSLFDINNLSKDLSNAVDGLYAILDNSVGEQVESIPPSPIPDGPRVAVLFSGGIDSTIIAFLADRHVPSGEPIDLLNVAFENPRRMRSEVLHDNKRSPKERSRKELPTSLNEGTHAYNVPDRLSGLEELEELRGLCPNRQWNFVEINISYTESSQAKEVIHRIMYPSKTVMDLSLGLALYFSSRASGVLNKSGQIIPYVSPAKVLLNGLGADELLGGYSRHRSAFKFGGWPEVVKQLQLELELIPNRNLGRDDRIASHHGKEMRHPFLSLSVVNSVSSLPVHLKTDPRLEAGLGDKLLLRLLAKKLGLKLAGARKKRAMQFGSYSARMEAGVGGGDGGKPLYKNA